MNRAVPASVAVHLVVLLLVVLFGAWVDRPVLTPRRMINVQIATMPERQAEPIETVEDVEPEAVDTPPEEQAPVIVEPEPIQVEPEPTVVPAEPDEQPVRDPEPEPVIVKPQPTAVEPSPATTPVTQEQTPDATAEATPDISSVTATDDEVPPRFQYYLTILQGKVSRQWQPKQVGIRESSSRYCVIHFFVERDGRITRETVARTSGVALFDKEALGAVRRAGRMPPLPAGITGAALGVSFSFTLKSGT